MKRMAWWVAAMAGGLFLGGTAWATVETDLRQAAADGRPVFLVVTQGAAPGIELARKVAGEARVLVPGALLAELDRGDPANAAVVALHRLASAPVPMILVIGSNGVAAGGAMPGSTTASKLAAMVPSPAKAAMLKAVAEGKPAFVLFTRATMPGRVGALAACREAALTLKGAAYVIQVGLDDPREAALAAALKVDPKAADAVTVVVNAKGQRVSAFLGVPVAKSLIETTTMKVGGCGCGPGGC